MTKGVDYTGVCVIFLCHDGKGNYLMHKRSKNTRDEHGAWDFGGGSLEFGEEIQNALKRELKEEYCVEPIRHEFLGFREAHREHNGAKTHWIALDFKVLVNPAEVKIGEPLDIDEIGWFKIDNFPTPLHSQIPKSLELYKDKL